MQIYSKQLVFHGADIFLSLGSCVSVLVVVVVVVVALLQ